MAFTVSSLQGEKPTVGTLLRANAALTEFLLDPDYEVTFRPVNPYTGGLVVVTDAALGNVAASGSSEEAPLEKVHSQAAYFVLLADEALLRREPGQFNLLDCRSHRLARVCRSSYSAELLGTEEGVDAVQLARGFVSLVRGGSLRRSRVDTELNSVDLVIVVDAKDVHDKASSDTSSFGSQKSLAFTVAWLRAVLRRPNTSARWTATSNMFADAGTKHMDLSHLRRTLSSGRWSITYSPAFVKQVSKGKKAAAASPTTTSAASLPGT